MTPRELENIRDALRALYWETIAALVAGDENQVNRLNWERYELQQRLHSAISQEVATRNE